MLRTGSRMVGRLVRQRATRSIGWEKAVTPLTPATWVNRYSAFESNLAQKKNEAENYNAEPAPIDWAHFEGKIAAPGLVAKLKAEYEASLVDGESAELDHKEIAETTAFCANQVEFLKTLDESAWEPTEKLHKEQLEYQIWCKENQFNGVSDWAAEMPGWEDQFAERFEAGDYHLTPEITKLVETYDLEAAIEYLKEGKLLTVADETCLEHEGAGIIGDFDYKDAVESLEEGHLEMLETAKQIHDPAGEGHQHVILKERKIGTNFLICLILWELINLHGLC